MVTSFETPEDFNQTKEQVQTEDDKIKAELFFKFRQPTSLELDKYNENQNMFCFYALLIVSSYLF